MNASQLGRKLRKLGIVVSRKKGTSHRDLYNPTNGKYSQLPTHGGRKQLGTGLIQKIYKDLGL